MINWGTVPAGVTLPFVFGSYDGTTGASEAISGLLVGDIEVYKGGSITQRSSDNGYALIDTDGIDIDGHVGINGFTIDTSDNTDAGFFVAGSFYTVVVASITADAQTVNFVAGTFRLSVADNTSGTPVVDVGRVANTAQTAGDICGKLGTPSNLGGGATIAFNLSDIEAQTDDIGAAGAGLTAVPWNAAWDAEVQSECADAITAASLPTAAATADAVWDEDATAHQTGGTFGQAIGDPAANTATIYAAVVTDAAGTNVAADIIAIKAETASILADTAEIGAAGAGLTSINLPNQTMDIVGNITGNLSGSVGSVTGAVGSVTGAVGSVTGAVGSVSGNVGGNVVGSVASVAATVNANLTQISGDTAAADTLEAMMDGVVLVQVNGVATTTSIPIDGFTSTRNDQFNGRLITILDGSGEQTDIVDYAHATQTLTVTALSAAPANDTFIVIH